jgi:chemotaxis protein methyltransferase CheR
MLLLEWLPAHPGYSARIIGTDISPKMVERARAGKFSQLEVNRGLRAPLLVKYFDQQGRDWIVKPQVKALTRFERGNLALPPVGVPQCDVVFLRNVLIYFDIPTKQRILARVRSLLRPDGYLFLGGAETTLNLDAGFERVQIGNAPAYRVRSEGKLA